VRKLAFQDLRLLPDLRLRRVQLQDLRPLHVRLRRLKRLEPIVRRVLTAPSTALFAVKTLNGVAELLISSLKRPVGRAAL
jgi:hypothetical protein